MSLVYPVFLGQKYDKIKESMKYLVPDFAKRNKSCIVAGGYPLSLYLLDATSSDSIVDRFFFSDIDIWALKDSDEDIRNVLKKYSDVTDPDEYREELDFFMTKLIGAESRIFRSSKFGNSFEVQIRNPNKYKESFGFKYISSYSVKYQALDALDKTIEELLDGFDIINCKAAIIEGRLAIDEHAIDLFERRALDISDSVIDRCLAHKAATVNRIFKYALRYNIEPTRKSVEFVRDVIIDILNLGFRGEDDAVWKELDDLVEFFETKNLESSSDLMFYAENEIPDALVSNSFRECIGKFGDFLRCRNFLEEDLLFFMNTGIPEIDKAVERYFEN